jgi:hypothetical protein
MKGHTFSGPARLKVEFGNVTIDKINNATITLGYAELNLDQAGEISFETRSSKIYLNTCEYLHLDSKRDHYYVKSAGEISGEAFFSYFNLDKVTSKINLKTNYGDIKLLGISESFLRMDLSSQYSDITIYLNEDHLYEFDIIRDERSQILSSTNVISKKEEPVAGVEKTFHATISAGKAGQPKVPVSINIKSGKIYLMGS